MKSTSLFAVLILALNLNTIVFADPHITLDPTDYITKQPITLDNGKVIPQGTTWYKQPDIMRLKEELANNSYKGDNEQAEKILFGYNIFNYTYFTIGEGRQDGNPPLAKGKVMSCSTCHVGGGTVPYAWPFFRTLTHFGLEEKGDKGEYWSNLGYFRDTRIRARDCARHCGGEVDIPEKSKEMDAVIAWLTAVRDGIYPGEGIQVAAFKEAANVNKIPGARLPLMPNVLTMSGNPSNGKQLFEQRCATCHGKDGLGKWNGHDGYIFPPLAGEAGFSNAGGPVMLPVAASFIQRFMPLQQKRMPEQDALDIMAYISNLARSSRWWQAYYFRHDPCARPAFLPLSIGAVPKGYPFSEQQTQFGPWTNIKTWLASDECRKANPKEAPKLARNFDPTHSFAGQ